MRTRFADYELAAAALIGGAFLFVSVGVLSDRGDLTSATLILSGVASFVAGLYLVTFSRGEPFDPRIAALLPVQSSIEISTLCANLGAGGIGHVLTTDTGTLVHYIPVAEFRPPILSEGQTFLLEGDGGHGILLEPSGKPLLALLQTEYGLTIPLGEAELLTLLEEVGQQVLSLASTVSAVRSGENIVIELGQYRLMDGCRMMRKISPRCCSIYPCPVCSLFACLLAHSTGKAFALEQAIPEGSVLRLIYEGIG